jgi:hypothetical protein
MPPRAKAKSGTKSGTKSGAKPGATSRVKSAASQNTASRAIDERVRELGGWRGETLARMRALVLAALPSAIEEWKWSNPVWSHGGIICTGEAYAKVVKLTFARGASVPDPTRLFNSSLDGNTRRAIDIREGETIDARAFKALVKAAAAINAGPPAKSPAASKTTASKTTASKTTASKTTANKATTSKSKPVRLLSGGNPQIAKADGDAPVQAYIAALSGWQRAHTEHVDALIVRTLPDVRKAVKWNSPFYGVEGSGWFIALHLFTRFLRVTFFLGRSLRPVPPGPSKDPHARYLDIHEDDVLDEAQFAKWVKQAAALPGYLAPPR